MSIELSAIEAQARAQAASGQGSTTLCVPGRCGTADAAAWGGLVNGW